MTGRSEVVRRPGVTVSVVVTACTVGDRLAGLLSAISAQTLVPREVLVVDNRPVTSGIAAWLAGRDLPLVHYVAAEHRGLSRARNAGLTAATGDLVAFTDDDVEVSADWLDRLTTPFDDPTVGCVTGQIVPLRVRTDTERWFEEFGGYSKGHQARRFTLDSARRDGLFPFRIGRFGSGANVAFRRSALAAVGGFDESLGAGTPALGGEDLDVFMTMLRAGRTIAYQPAARVAHPSHVEYLRLRRQLFGYGAGLSAALTKRFVTCADDRRAMLGTGPAALRYLLSAKSGKNSARSADYPKALIAAELLGVALGPGCYLRSRLVVRRLARSAASSRVRRPIRTADRGPGR